MDINKLFQACVKFEKLAQQKIVLDPKKSNVGFYSKLLYNAIISYSQLLRSPQVAKSIFDAIAKYHQTLASNSDVELKQVDSVLTGLQESEAKLQQAKINPIEVLKQRGMQNVNPNILNILKTNLQILKDGKDFSKYQHFYLPKVGEPKDIIELDEVVDKNNPGY